MEIAPGRSNEASGGSILLAPLQQYGVPSVKWLFAIAGPERQWHRPSFTSSRIPDILLDLAHAASAKANRPRRRRKPECGDESKLDQVVTVASNGLVASARMKSAKPLPADAPAHRRSQPVRQTRTNPARSAANASRPGGGRDGQASDQAIDIFPAITHFSDTITALPKELVRHFTLLKEVDAKLFAPEEQLFKLVAEAAATPLPYPPANVEAEAASAAARTSASTAVQKHSSASSAHQASTDEATATASFVFDHANVPRRQLFRQTALKIQEMLVSLEEKNHVLSTANEALQRQLARVEDVWPHLENEFSAEAKWGSTTHWAYPENRNSKASHAERARRDGAAAISAAAQALADEAAARSDARKQAVQAKRNQKNQHLDSDADDLAGRNKGEGKKTQKARRTAEGNVGLGISGGASTNGNPPPKRRKVERTTNGGEPMERVMSNVLANSAPKVKTSSPRGTPAPDGPRKRKALPSGSGQSKKKYDDGPSIPPPPFPPPPLSPSPLSPSPPFLSSSAGDVRLA
ncbi:hypothetical protein DCS_07645 [Drechmeria coniospora]|uniref:Inhibitor of growth protein N-terminal histone-binding domain-containing protein n=1 Tax=Drechmeria coniospora TaxID=98403 RepID=A0A151GF50_DRECN|nr:hypothetical protein DCS_07645 [Drechmeria coniospora]KYK55681.1 hypothetical protein DCS_07645 [Drechmeria coniospora]